jgi:hypothetical protein
MNNLVCRELKHVHPIIIPDIQVHVAAVSLCVPRSLDLASGHFILHTEYYTIFYVTVTRI